MIDPNTDSPKGIPVFCVKTTEKTNSRTVYINFKSTDSIVPPEVDLDEEELCEEIRNPSVRIENFKIPMKISPIHWGVGEDSEKTYVVDVFVNDKFCIRRVLTSDIIRHYLTYVTMTHLEEKFNGGSAKKLGQFIGHKLELNQMAYEVLDDRQSVDKSSELVNNKITLVEPTKNDSTKAPNMSEESTYDLYYRPRSKVLTCSVGADRLPDSIGFNDDRIIIKMGDKTIVDTHLPFYIDLNEPMKYKFDDKLCLFRAVFRIKESS